MSANYRHVPFLGITQYLYNMKTSEKIEKIKAKLVEVSNSKDWKTFIDKQVMGDCKKISGFVCMYFKVDAVCGTINIGTKDQPNYIVHYWNTIRGIDFDFAKGTCREVLKRNINDLYKPEISDQHYYA